MLTKTECLVFSIYFNQKASSSNIKMCRGKQTYWDLKQEFSSVTELHRSNLIYHFKNRQQ